MPQFLQESHYNVTIHHEEDGSLWAEVLEMPGCFVSGDSIEEIQEALREAMSLYLTSKNVDVNIHNLEFVGTVVAEDSSGSESYKVLIPA